MKKYTFPWPIKFVNFIIVVELCCIGTASFKRFCVFAFFSINFHYIIIISILIEKYYFSLLA